MQAVARFNPWERVVGNGAGNGFSAILPVVEADETAKTDAKPLVIDHVVAPHKFEETPWSKLLEVRSELLSRFYGRDVALRGCVTLPTSYEKSPKRRYPVIFTIPGFGGTHLDARRTSAIEESNARGVEFLRVVLDPSCPLGHHVFADSANNGPVGTALVSEFIPELVHNRSGVGSHVIALDVNKDGVTDIVSSVNRGTFIFWGKKGPWKR